MKYFFYLSFFIFSCSSNAEKEKQPATHQVKTTPDSTAPEKPVLVAIPDDSVTINGTALYSSYYCGGARPSEEMMEEARRPKPFYLGSLYIKTKGSDEKIKVSTNLKGKFSCRLKPGNYEVLLASNSNAEGDYWYDPGVPKAWWQKQVFARFMYADTSKKNVRFTLDLICDPLSRKRP